MQNPGNPLPTLEERVSALEDTVAYLETFHPRPPDPPPPPPPPPPGGTNQQILDMQPNTWLAAPNSRMDAVLPPNNVGGSFNAIMSAWSGGAFDTSRNRLLVWGGGHLDYAGNELYAFNVDTFLWERLTDPSDPPGNNTNYASDGNPTSRHTYGALVYIPTLDEFVSFGATGLYGDSAGSNRKVDGFSFSSGSWVQGKPDHSGEGNTPVSAYDPVEDQVWTGTDQVSRYDVQSNSWSGPGPWGASDLRFLNNLSATIDPTRRLMVMVGDGITATVDITSLNAPVVRNTSGASGIESGAPGVAFDGSQVLAWNGGATVYSLDLDSWVWSSQSGTGDVPTVATPNGTFGRFRYMPDYHACIAVNAIDEDVYIYKCSS